MADLNDAGRATSASAPLIAKVLRRYDDNALAARAANLHPDDQVLFPIVVAIARLVARAEVRAATAATRLEAAPLDRFNQGKAASVRCDVTHFSEAGST